MHFVHFSFSVVADKSPGLNSGSDKNRKSREMGKVQSETLSTRFQKSYFRANHLWRRPDGPAAMDASAALSKSHWFY